MLPKKGIVFPNGENPGPYPMAIAHALRNQLGVTHQTVKIVMGWIGAENEQSKIGSLGSVVPVVNI
jgi:hypothetical protein